MAYLIDRITKSLQKEGLSPRTNKARAWLRSKVSDLNPSKQALLVLATDLPSSTILTIGDAEYHQSLRDENSDSSPHNQRYPVDHTPWDYTVIDSFNLVDYM